MYRLRQSYVWSYSLKCNLSLPRIELGLKDESHGEKKKGYHPQKGKEHIQRHKGRRQSGT
jgi:hypothetical protein